MVKFGLTYWRADFLLCLMENNKIKMKLIHISSRKHAYIILIPLKPHFYIVKLGFTGVYNIFLISAQKHRLWVSLEPPHRGGSNEYLNLCFEQKYEKYQSFFYLNISQFLEVKFSIYLNRRVFVMYIKLTSLFVCCALWSSCMFQNVMVTALEWLLIEICEIETAHAH